MFDEYLSDLTGKGAYFAYGLAGLLVIFVSGQACLTHPAFQRHLSAVPGLVDGMRGLTAMVVIGLGVIHRRHFGRAGRWGLLRSWLATGDIAVLTAALVGVCVMPLSGAMYGPLVLCLTLIDQPTMAMLLIAAATLGHAATASTRARCVNL